jgi:hypothetical protein
MPTTRRPLAIIQQASIGVLILLGTAAGGCGVGCTLIACDSGLTVRVQPAPSVAYRVEVVSGGTGTRNVFRCNTPGACSDAIFHAFFPARAVVEVITNADTVRREFANIRYDKVQPNGADCDPTCRIAMLTVDPR